MSATNVARAGKRGNTCVGNNVSSYARAFIVIHEYIYSHSTTELTFKKYIYSHLLVYFLFTIIFAHIYEMSSFTFNVLYSLTFTIEIFIQHFLRITFAHHWVLAPPLPFLNATFRTEGNQRPMTPNTSVTGETEFTHLLLKQPIVSEECREIKNVSKQFVKTTVSYCRALKGCA